MIHRYRSNGKLLITGEYVVLDGALSFALPCKFGQTLTITETTHETIHWNAFDCQNNSWLTVKVNLLRLKELSTNCILETSDPEKAKTLVTILIEAIKINPDFLKKSHGIEATTQLEFPRNWGLGSSSTLINNIASWAQIDAFTLLWNSFSGSGYDIACAQNNTAIEYRLYNKQPHVDLVSFNPSFKKNLFFVHLNKKQNSREGVTHYRNTINSDKKEDAVKIISTLTKQIQQADTLKAFEDLLNQHENIIGNLINTLPIKKQLFEDYKGVVKSLGAWGGDFVLATGENAEVSSYFKKKGYKTVIPYEKMILCIG